MNEEYDPLMHQTTGWLGSPPSQTRSHKAIIPDVIVREFLKELKPSKERTRVVPKKK